MQPAAACGLQQLRVGNAAPQEERQTRSEFQIRQWSRVAAGRRIFAKIHPVQEAGTGQDSGQSAADTGVEVLGFAARGIQCEQLIPRSRIQLAPESPVRQLGYDAFGARLLLGRSRGIAGKDLLAARGLSHTAGVERPADLERSQPLNPVLTPARRHIEQTGVRLREAAREESDADLVQPRGGLEANTLQTLIDRVDSRVLLLVDRLHVRFTTDGRAKELLTVEHPDHRVLELHVLHPQGACHVGDRQRVFAVGGEVVLNNSPAARAER